MEKSGSIPQEVAKQVLADALGLYVGRGKRFTVEDLAAASGQSERTLRAYMDGSTSPALAGLLTLFAVMPDSFVNQVMRLAGYRVVPLDAGEIDVMEHTACLAEVVHALVVRFADRRITHVEALELLPLVQRAQDQMPAMIATLRRAADTGNPIT